MTKSEVDSLHSNLRQRTFAILSLGDSVVRTLNSAIQCYRFRRSLWPTAGFVTGILQLSTLATRRDSFTFPIVDLVYPPKFCITIVSNFSWVSQASLEKSKTMVMQILGQTRCIMGNVKIVKIVMLNLSHFPAKWLFQGCAWDRNTVETLETMVIWRYMLCIKWKWWITFSYIFKAAFTLRAQVRYSKVT